VRWNGDASVEGAALPSCGLARGPRVAVAQHKKKDEAMSKPGMLGQAALVLAAWISLGACAQAFDLTGLWATDSEACGKIFATKGKKTSFQKDSDLYGGGFIIDGNRIRGRTASCNIRSKKEDGANIHLMTACATDIMLQNVQFSVKVVDDNRITRVFPGIEGMELDYVRCPARP
jgi:hypothetical protein